MTLNSLPHLLAFDLTTFDNSILPQPVKKNETFLLNDKPKTRIFPLSMPSTMPKSKTKSTTSPNSTKATPSPGTSIKKRPRVTGRPLIKLEDDILHEKVDKMRKQYEVANSRLIILADRIAKHEHEVKCRKHDLEMSEQLAEEMEQEEEETEA